MAKIKWTPQALDDVEDIANFIGRDSVYYAGIFTAKIFEAVERLELFREIILGDYRIIYRVKEDIVEILTIYHSARLLEAKKIEDLL